MNVGKLCSRDLVSASASTPLSDVAALMHRRGVGAVVITKAPIDQPVAVGIVTDRDIMRAQLTRTADFNRLSAADVMTRDPLVLEEHHSVEDAILRMRERGVRRAPVMDAHGQLVGMISLDDLVGQLAYELGNLARVLERQPRRHDG
ncbi:MAG: CBS domain-containing protein [Pseudomonadota bacterium]|jgi:Predicted signal-transduction protein containing cAMP-binding and CBS domains